MNTIQLYIEESLDSVKINTLKNHLIDIEYVNDVEVSSNSPHYFLIEFEEHHGLPMKILEAIKEEGYHPDIYSG
ncbi:hypothetical protein MNBD_GAMMA21-848 [hydrothermal vent metagenome]|uniref:HMA domain-containing protein n=1 Tax=hydrothermal vent metagenome TaxID=652676 RepID=A0A3B1ABY6_9ZZZZ